MFEVGEIFASEVTEEIYDFLLHLTVCCFSDDREFYKFNKGKLCEHVMENYKFLNQKFTTKGFKHKIIKAKEETIKEELCKLE